MPTQRDLLISGPLPPAPGAQQHEQYRREMAMTLPGVGVPGPSSSGPAVMEMVLDPDLGPAYVFPTNDFMFSAPSGSTLGAAPEPPRQPNRQPNGDQNIPALLPRPPPPTSTYQIPVGSGKLTKEIVCREFVLVETRIQDLEYQLQTSKDQNAVLRDEIRRMQESTLEAQKQVDRRLKELQTSIDERFANLGNTLVTMEPLDEKARVSKTEKRRLEKLAAAEKAEKASLDSMNSPTFLVRTTSRVFRR